MKRYKYLIYTILASVLTTSCIHYGDEQSIALSEAVTDITVSEARSFYENDIMSRVDTESPKIKLLSPGDYTPQWGNAKMSQNSRIACVDVPIISTYRYRAIRSEFSRGRANAYKVDISQKLVIVKDRESGAMASYVMSLIPDKTFAAKHKGDISNLFLDANDRGKYSGAIFYTHYGLPVKYVHYTDGSEDCNISTLGDIDQTAKAENFRNIMKKFIGIKFKKTRNILSRDGENDPEEPEEDPFEFPGLYPIGGGYYIDNDGNFYFDANEDGIPELEFNIYEDPHESEETNHENNNTNPDEGDGGGGPQGEVNSYFISKGNEGFDRIYDDLYKEYLRVKKLRLWNGEYILKDHGLNASDLNAIHNRYMVKILETTYKSVNAETFGRDIFKLWHEKGMCRPYWMRDEVVTIIVLCDDRFSGNFIDTVSAQLDDMTVIVQDEIDITVVNGISKFTVGLTIR